MWEQLMVDSDEEYFGSDEEMEARDETPPPPGLTGLALAQHYFGPLLSPVAATPAKWTAYAEHRRSAAAAYKTLFDRRKRYMSSAIADIEAELSLDAGTLQKCIYVLDRGVWHDDDVPRGFENGVRIYSPTAPGYVDVHAKYYACSRMYSVDWYYALGYKIHHRALDPPTGYCHPPTRDDVSRWHSRNGWQSISWGHFDNSGDNYGQNWREIEKGQVELHEEGVLHLHEVLFGQAEPPTDDPDAVLAYRRKLVATVRLLLAAVGITYKVACADGEKDEGSHRFNLEALSDRWVGRGIRAACGFQLSGDAEAAKHGQEERIKEATRDLKDDYGDDDDEDDEHGSDSDDH